MENQKEKIYESLKKIESWVESHDYKGYEPFDGLSSYLNHLTFHKLFLERVLQQSVRRIPTNIRPLIGVKEQDSTKGRGYMAAGYLFMYRSTASQSYLERAISCLEWLDKNKSPFYEKHSWGNHFDFSSRGGKLPAFDPIIVWTSLIGQAFIDAYGITHEQRFFDIIKSVCDWILALPREKTERGSCLSYVADHQSSIHNSNLLGAAMLARSSRHLGDPSLLATAKEAVEYSCSRQRPDGSWWYGEDPTLQWIDNFHTGYNLDSLKCYIDSSQDRSYESSLKKGLDFYKNRFFLEDGTPKYYHNKTYPIDSQCVSQAVETLANFSDYDDEALALGLKVANWAIDHMQDKKRGFFYFRRYPFGVVDKTPMLHWAQTTMYKALALLYGKV
jgi:hypothetical protein